MTADCAVVVNVHDHIDGQVKELADHVVGERFAGIGLQHLEREVLENAGTAAGVA